MSIFQAVVYGIVQGLTEFLPISSSGHLFLVPVLLKWKDAGAGFSAVIQLGTLLAVLIYFWSDLAVLFKAWIRSFTSQEARISSEAKIAWGVVWGTIPIMVVGLLLKHYIESSFRSPWIVAGTLIVFGLLMGLAESMVKGHRTMGEMRVRDGILVGLWQCLALIPGSSRSGSTITGALFMGMDRASAARYSFLLSVPAVFLAGVYKLFDERKNLLADGPMQTVVATVVAFVVGYAAIAWLMKFLQTRSLWPFVWYRVVLGIVILGLGLAGFYGAGG